MKDSFRRIKFPTIDFITHKVYQPARAIWAICVHVDHEMHVEAVRNPKSRNFGSSLGFRTLETPPQGVRKAEAR